MPSSAACTPSAPRSRTPALAARTPPAPTIYVTLEPCAHEGRQPPCTEAILEAGLARVVYASEDPTEKASGRGPGMLRDGGVEVELANGAEAAAARLLNQPFRKWARTGRPLVTYKAAMTLDGRVAAPGGDSRWISCAESRELVHRWRAECDAIAVGIGTALADDPLLTARSEPAESRQDGERQPTRVLFDSMARLPALLGAGRLPRRSAPDRGLLARGAHRRGAMRSSPPAPRWWSHRVETAASGSARRWTSSDDVSSRTSCWREARPWRAPSSTPVRSTRCASSWRRSLVGAGEARALLEGAGARRIADGLRPLAMGHETVGEDLLIAARLREW